MLTVTRTRFFSNTTIGVLTQNGVHVCFTLEDALREPGACPEDMDRSTWVKSWKIPSKTAIPAGVYPLTISYSNRFKKKLPEVKDVPGFTGIRFHGGNTSEDTEGCILVGLARDPARRLISNCAPALKQVYNLIESGETWLTIR